LTEEASRFFGRVLERTAEPLGLLEESKHPGVRYECDLFLHVLERAKEFPDILSLDALFPKDSS